MNHNDKWIVQEPVAIYFSESSQGTKDNLDIPRQVGHSVWADIDTERTKTLPALLCGSMALRELGNEMSSG